jgi:hypothetical protein
VGREPVQPFPRTDDVLSGVTNQGCRIVIVNNSTQDLGSAMNTRYPGPNSAVGGPDLHHRDYPMRYRRRRVGNRPGERDGQRVCLDRGNGRALVTPGQVAYSVDSTRPVGSMFTFAPFWHLVAAEMRTYSRLPTIRPCRPYMVNDEVRIAVIRLTDGVGAHGVARAACMPLPPQRVGRVGGEHRRCQARPAARLDVLDLQLSVIQMASFY